MGEIDLRIVDAFSNIILNTMPCHTDQYPFYEPPLRPSSGTSLSAWAKI